MNEEKQENELCENGADNAMEEKKKKMMMKRVQCRRKTGSLEIRDDCTFSFFTFYSQRPGSKTKIRWFPVNTFILYF